MTHHYWSEDKIRRFVKSWNEGLEMEALREKYGTKQPAAMAVALRRRGYDLVVRRALLFPLDTRISEMPR